MVEYGIAFKAGSFGDDELFVPLGSDYSHRVRALELTADRRDVVPVEREISDWTEIKD